MKGFIISIILFSVIIILVICNIFYVQNTSDKMKELADNVMDSQKSSDTEMSELSEYWKKHSELLGMSANFRDTDKISEELIKFEAAYRHGNRLAMEQSYALLCDALEDIARYERLSLGAIF